MIYSISYKTFIDSKPLRIRCFKIDGIIGIYDETRSLTLFGSWKYETIYNRIRYLINQKRDSTYIFSHYFTKIKVDSYNSLSLEKKLTLHNVILQLNQLFINKDNNNIFRKMLSSINQKIITKFCS